MNIKGRENLGGTGVNGRLLSILLQINQFQTCGELLFSFEYNRIEPGRKEFPTKGAKLHSSTITYVARQLPECSRLLAALTAPQLVRKLPNQESDYRVHKSLPHVSIPFL